MRAPTATLAALGVAALLLLGGCSKSSSASGAQPTGPNPLVNPALSNFQVTTDGGALDPREAARGFRLECREAEEPAITPRSKLVSNTEGFYDTVEADLGVSTPPAPIPPTTPTAPSTLSPTGGTIPTPPPLNFDVFLGIDVADDDGVVQVRAGLVVEDDDVSVVVEILDGLGLAVESSERSLGYLPSVEGERYQFRIEVDTENDMVRFLVDGSREYTYIGNNLRVPMESELSIEATGETFLAFVEDTTLQKTDNTIPRLAIDGNSLEPAHAKPGMVRFLFTLRDNTDSIITLAEQELGQVTLHFTEDESPIDPFENNPLFQPANLPLDLVIVLDYSRSMADAGGIQPMVQGAKNLASSVWASNPNNRIQFMEFHDARQPTGTIIGFTTDEAAAFAALDGFSPFHGFSSVWNAVHDALGQLPVLAAPRQASPAQAVEAVVFLTDGIDNSSIQTPDDIITRAGSGMPKKHVFCIGVNAAPSETRVLRRIAALSRGAFFETGNVSGLGTTFDELTGAIGGFYSASYITSTARFGAVTTTPPLDVELGVTLTRPSATNPGGLEVLTTDSPLAAMPTPEVGDERRGILRLEQLPVIGNTTRIRIYADFVPRDITTFGIMVTETTGNVVFSAELGTGLLQDWSAPALMNGFFTTSTPGGELAFGDFGHLLDIAVSNVTAGFTATITINNDLYAFPETLFWDDNQGGRFPSIGTSSNYEIPFSVTFP